ncbi:unnamed protein product [Paramecium primaurelia]|uniref:Uncharacterized protein n=1 Tax=Paramecium primaurelia TaxID=5886 RepID=A0A8S1QGC8_PARPR|nr:unnamed protein product [Paramecium primaurelia]
MSNLIEYINLDLRASVLYPQAKKYLRTSFQEKKHDAYFLNILCTWIRRNSFKINRILKFKKLFNSSTLRKCIYKKKFFRKNLKGCGSQKNDKSLFQSLILWNIKLQWKGYQLQQYKYTITTYIKIKNILEKDFYLLIRIINSQSENNNNGTFVDIIIKRISFKNTQKFLFVQGNNNLIKNI